MRSLNCHNTCIAMFADNAISFYSSLRLTTPLPDGVEILNPYVIPEVRECVARFYHKFFNDSMSRVGVFGINPGRHGGGLTGLSFTDPVALREQCGIPNNLGDRRELSSDFVYRAVNAFGGVGPFYSGFYLSALCPLGFTRGGLNYNFYD